MALTLSCEIEKFRRNSHLWILRVIVRSRVRTGGLYALEEGYTCQALGKSFLHEIYWGSLGDFLLCTTPIGVYPLRQQSAF